MTLLTVSQQRALINIARFGERYGYWHGIKGLSIDSGAPYQESPIHRTELRRFGWVIPAPTKRRAACVPTPAGVNPLNLLRDVSQ